jgi:nucleoside-diphosphate-sugar epimerase
MKTILITGANGVLARKFIENYAHQYKIISAVRNPKTSSEIKFIGWQKIDYLVNCDLVIHFAGRYLIDQGIESQKIVSDAVVGTSTSILDYCSETKTPLIALGSFFEKAPEQMSPWSYYAVAKKTAFNLIKLASESKEIPTRYIYCYDTYGKDLSRRKIVDVLLDENTNRLDLSLGEQILNLTHIEDLVSAIQIVCEEMLNGTKGFKTQQIKHPSDQYSLRELANCINELRRTKIDLRFGSKPYREKEVFEMWESAETVNNWNPKVNFKDFARYFLSVNYGE